MGKRLRVGVVGCGVIAQVKHLPLLAELPDRYEVVALCDLSREVAEACRARFGATYARTRWQDLLELPLDALWVLTGGSHAPIAAAAARAGLHLFIEKPLCVSSAEGRELVADIDASGVVAMVGYMKRYDPAYLALREVLSRVGDLRLARATTLEAPFGPYLAHQLVSPGPPLDPALAAELAADDLARVRRAIGEVDEHVRRTYRGVLLDSMVHDLNAVRGLLGEPDELVFAEIHAHGVIAVLRFGALPCVLSWTDLPGLVRYEQELAFYGASERAVLSFGSPFLRDNPGRLLVEGGEPGTARSWRREETVAYDSAFKRELLAFHDAVHGGPPPPTTPADALRDVELCEQVVAAHLARAGAPTAPIGGPA